MGYPRSQLVVPGAAGSYHCVSRCVRRAFLCGQDPLTGRSFEHRKDWIEARLLELAEVFSISVLAYAVMSNHVHAVLRLDPSRLAAWSDAEVAARWVRLFPVRDGAGIDVEGCQLKAAVLTGNDDRMAVLRARLGDLSWFMRCLAEPLTRLANREDGCSGRFWEGRFRCQALLDDAAVLAAMSYVDLNPIRAGLADRLEDSAHTSVVRRLVQPEDMLVQPLDAVAGPTVAGCLPISEGEYLRLVDWTGRQLRPGKRGRIPADAPPLLAACHLDAHWLDQVRGVESRFCRAIGSARALLDKAREIGQHWLMVRRVERLV